MLSRRVLAVLLLICADGFADDAEFFENRVRPLLATKCYSCHGSEKQFGNLRLDSRDGILRGGNAGPAAIVGKPEDSLLIKAVRHELLKMPLGGKLKPEEIAALEQWIKSGLPWTESKAVKLAAGDPGFYESLIREHWAFQSVKKPMVPKGKGSNPIDRFILAKLEEKGLATLGQFAGDECRTVEATG